MQGSQDQIWVTSVLSDSDVKKALTLYCSLRRTFTKRKIAVLLSAKLTSDLSDPIWRTFDIVFNLEEDGALVHLNPEDIARIYALKIFGSYNTVVYVSPSVLALQNVDTIFAEPTETFKFLEDDSDDSVFMFKPSYSKYKAISEALAKLEATDLVTYLRTWTKNQGIQNSFLSLRYRSISKTDNRCLEIFDSQLLNLASLHDESDFERLNNSGFIGKFVASYWMKIQRECVDPLIQSCSNGTMAYIPGQPPLPNYNQDCIAIVGMSCRFPGSNNIQEFWKLISHGQDGTGKPPDFRWQQDQACRHVSGAKNTNAGFLSVPVDEFDTKFFGISPKEADFLDPQHRLLHELVWESLENAAIDPHTLYGTSGSVFVGSWMNDYKEILMTSGNQEFFRVYMGNSIGACSARISFLLGMTGPSIATESGCSSAMVAVHMACKSLQSGESCLALAAGVNMLLHPFDGNEMPMVVSPDGKCKTFSEDANGFARAEGGGVLVLKRFSDAISNGDRIWGIIRGSAISQEGISKSMGTPTVQCESLAMKNALKDANVAPELVSYLETHGTGTSVGDPMEVAAIADAYYSPLREIPLIIGSVKTNVGHTESCSGITGIIKVVLSMYNEIIPAHLNFTKLNPLIDLESVPAIIPIEQRPWSKDPNKPRIAGVSSFGITGTDAHVIVQEAPEINFLPRIPTEIQVPEKVLHILKLSTKTEEAMSALLKNYQQFLNKTEENIEDICYTANIGRANFSNRTILLAHNKTELAEQIQSGKYIRGDLDRESFSKKLCLLFTGQGSQFPGMAKDLYEFCPVFKVHFDYCASILNRDYNVDIQKILWSDKSTMEEISQTLYSQTSIFSIEYALLKLWKSWGIKPDYVLGHSLGEFAAAVCTDQLDIDVALRLVAERSKLIETLKPGKMLVIKDNMQQVSQLLKSFAKHDTKKLLDYAAMNSNSQTVLAGDSETVLDLAEFCSKNGKKSVILNSTHAFHSKHMDSILKDYRQIANALLEKNSNLRNNRCGYISGMEGDLVTNETLLNAEYWVKHTREPVKFLRASQKAVELGCNIFIEVGPQPVLTALTMINNESSLLCLPSMKKTEKTWNTLLKSLGELYVKGMDICWNGFYKLQNRNKVNLPTYPFLGKKFWPDMMQSTESSFHPLVGRLLPNASQLKLFQCSLNLKTHEWIKDHAIGNNIIFPGAGYLEICLASGYAAIFGTTDSQDKPLRPVKIQNLNILNPLVLQEAKTKQLQTVVEYDVKSTDKMDLTTIKIYQRHETDNDKWIRHADAEFLPVINQMDNKIPFNLVNIESFTRVNLSTVDEVQNAYDKLASVGLNFGPLFQSIEKLWKKDNITLAKVKFSIAEHTGYIAHPIIIDAMIQAIMLPHVSTKLNRKLMVPIHIGSFVWLSPSPAPYTDLFVQVQNVEYNNKNSNISSQNMSMAVLTDASGSPLATMSNVELIETTSRAINSLLEQHTNPMADLWKENWCRQIGPCERSCNLNSLSTSLPNDVRQEVLKYNDFSGDIVNIFRRLDQIVYSFMLKTLYNFGWNPHENGTNIFDDVELFKQLKIEQRFQRQFKYFLRVFEEEGIIQQLDSTSWKIICLPPSLSDVEADVEKPINELVEVFHSTLLITKIGKHLPGILKGTQSALGILFPEEKQDSSAAEIYLEYSKLLGFEPMVKQINTCWFNMYNAKEGKNDNIFRILEVGAGTGAYTGMLLKVLENCGIQFEYTYTDISAAFFSEAEKRFSNVAKNITFKKLNIEEDPLVQGFIPGYYDYICASDVVHATKDIKQTLGNVRILLKPGGYLELSEQFRVNRFITFIFGLLDGFWRFEDTELRKDHCVMGKEMWCDTLRQIGFEISGVYTSGQGLQGFIKCKRTFEIENTTDCIYKQKKTWLIFHEPENLESEFLINSMENLARFRNVVTVIPGEEQFKKLSLNCLSLRSDCEEDFNQLIDFINDTKDVLEGILYCWSLKRDVAKEANLLKPYLFLTKSICRLHQNPYLRFCSLIKGVAPIEGSNLELYNGAFVGFTKSLQNEHSNWKCKIIDVGNPAQENEYLQIFYELWNHQKEIFVAFQGLQRYVPKLCPLKAESSSLEFPQGCGNRFQLAIPETKSIRDLEFTFLDQFDLEKNEIEIEVKASALNFRDVLSVIKPSDDFANSNAVGFDFAGVVKATGQHVKKWEVGDRVFGVNTQGTALPSHILLNEDEVLRIPENLSFCEACTLPAVVATSYHCLIEIANVKPSDVVLIHAASGGVGLSAIELCKHIGATVIATAGSKRKRNFLRNLGIEHVFHSRNTQFSYEILKVTNGIGVDVVLNSLTSEGFKEATLNCCAQGARFVEMSLLSIWKPEEIKKLRPDIKYSLVDLSKSGKEKWKVWFKNLSDLLQKQILHPIPFTIFGAQDIQNALNYMQKARHIGKIVCVLPEVREHLDTPQIYTPLFSNSSTYLITGGLGGIGFEVCQWMVDMGAKFVVLVGRNPPNSVLEQAILKINSKYHAKVATVQLDVGDFAQCNELINFKIPAMNYPKLKGVMHVAGTLSDGIIENHTWETFSATFASKIHGTVNLHRLTKNIRGLEHFVLFSSIAALLGPPAQSNHAAGNCFEDYMAHYRHSLGLPATTVNWGQWSEVGVATEAILPGLKPFSTKQGISALEYALKNQHTHIGVMNMESVSVIEKIMPFLRSYLDDRVWKKSTSGNFANSASINSEILWQTYDSKDSLDEKVQILKDVVSNLLRQILKLEDTEIIDENADFQEMGMDSLMFVDIKNSLQLLLGDRITVSASVLKDCNTLDLLSRTLVKMIEGDGTIEQETIPTAEEVNALILEDCVLPEDIKSAISQEKVNVKDISCVLLTGVTGNLGPYVLRELCNRSQIKQVICLIRPTSKMSSEERLDYVLKKRNLFNEICYDKIRCISGNIAEERLGLNENTWKMLANSVDAICNCAARVQHWELYKNREGVIDTRNVNLKSVKNVLKLACTGNKLKHVYSASTLLTSTQTNEKGTLSEDWYSPEDFTNVTSNAYPVSKFVGENLLKTAILERGIPGKVFRFPIIVGDSNTGQFVLDQNHLMLRYFFILKTGMIPINPIPVVMLPVDICAKISIELFLNPGVPDDVYNICNKDPTADQEFIKVAEKLGYHVVAVEFSEFAQKIRDLPNDDSPFALFKEFYRNDEEFLSLFNTTPVLKQWLLEGASRNDFFVSTKIKPYIPEFYKSEESSMDYIYRDMLFAKSMGWLEKFV